MNIKNEILIRVYIVMVIILVVAILIFAKAVQISVLEGEYWRSKGDSLYVKPIAVQAERGNILAEDGSLLATSLPFFEIRFDPNSTAMAEDDFANNLDSLAFCLATYVDNTYTVGGYYQYLLEQREAGKRNVLIKRKASYSEMQMIKKFPLFRKGRYRGGLIVQRRSERKRPFGILAHRTIGYVREGAKPVGLEGSFNKILAGKEGKQMMQRAGDAWIPINDLTEIEPVVGDDVVTTIDINLQDITEQALIRAIQYHQAKNGTAVLMEVHTGAIKAIANIDRTPDGYWESYNHAVGSAVEPGSTYKLAAIMALLEDGHVRLNDSIDIEKGEAQFYEEVMVDASRESFNSDTISIQRAFEISSNVGLAKLVDKHYNQNRKAEKYIERLQSFNLHIPTGIEIKGEATPYLKEAYNEEEDWSGITLPWMSIGYELTITPLQLLSFYNAIANDGVMMKPYLTSSIERFGETVQTFKPTVIKRRIASAETIRQAQFLLESVVKNGTAQPLYTDRYRFAGKTGTAQINYRKFDRRRSNIKHRASFVGYFPADNPVYSCIVMISEPTQNGIYGGEVAGPVFREIADKCMATRTELYRPLNTSPAPQLVNRRLPDAQLGHAGDYRQLLETLDLPHLGPADLDWTYIEAVADTLRLYSRNFPEEQVPNVVGMGLRDALYLLENRGLKVVVSGAGKVVLQSLRSGTPIRGQTIKLTLN